MELAPRIGSGEVIAARYRLERLLGSGAFGDVWLARDDARSGAEIALKLLHAKHRNPRVRARFLREAELLARLDHPGVARAFDHRCDDALAYIAIEYVPGDTLLLHLLGLPRPPIGDALEGLLSVFRETCETVAYAHGLGVIHRDLKPANIIVTDGASGPRAKVLDFGVAKILDTEAADQTTKGRVLGTASYCSPEQFTGMEIGAPADVFALGVILFELLTLRRAWLLDADGRPLPLGGKPELAGNDPPAVASRIVRGERPRVRAFRPELPPAIDEVLARALEPHPLDRIESPAALWQHVSRALGPALERSHDGTAPSGDDAHPTKISMDLSTVVFPQVLDRPPGDGSSGDLARALRSTLEPAATAMLEAHGAQATRPIAVRPKPSLSRSQRAAVVALVIANVLLLAAIAWPYFR